MKMVSKMRLDAPDRKKSPERILGVERRVAEVTSTRGVTEAV